MIIDAVFKEEEALKADFGVLSVVGGGSGISLDYAHKTFANALKGSASGNAVKLCDVSPLEHEIGVKLSKEEKTYEPDYEASLNFTLELVENSADWYQCGDGLHTVESVNQEANTVTFTDGKYIVDRFVQLEDYFTVGQVVWFDGVISFYPAKEVSFDPTTVTLTKYGKNLLNLNNADKRGVGEFKVEGNRLTYTNENGNGSTKGSLWCTLGKYKDFVGKTITISYTFVDSNGDYSTFNTFINADASTIVSASKLDANKKFKLTCTIPENDTAENLILRFYIGYIANNQGEYVIIDNLQVEIGDNVTEWEEYKEPEPITPNADGTAEGIIGKGESITLMTDTEGVNIEAEYNKDLNKVFESLVNAIISLGGNV
jgi:hypothetical protein